MNPAYRYGFPSLKNKRQHRSAAAANITTHFSGSGKPLIFLASRRRSHPEHPMDAGGGGLRQMCRDGAPDGPKARLLKTQGCRRHRVSACEISLPLRYVIRSEYVRCCVSVKKGCTEATHFIQLSLKSNKSVIFQFYSVTQPQTGNICKGLIRLRRAPGEVLKVKEQCMPGCNG